MGGANRRAEAEKIAKGINLIVYITGIAQINLEVFD